MDNPAAECVECEKVDVLLTWTDFLHSLETLRHKPYSVKSHERDWFRLNPLDIVLLGLETVKNRQQASKKISHTSIAIQDISSQIFRKPRIFQHIILCLGKVLKYPEVGSAVVQKCCIALVDLYEASLQCPRINYFKNNIEYIENNGKQERVQGGCIHIYFEDILPILTKLGKCQHVTGNPSTRIKVEWLMNNLQEFKDKAVAVQEVSLTLERDCNENPIFIRILEGLLDQFNEIHISVALQIVLLKESDQNLDLAAKQFDLVALSESFSEILVQLNNGDVDCNHGIRILLQIFQIVFSELARNHVAAYVNDTEIVGGTGEQVMEYTSTGKELIIAFSALLNKIESHLTKWNSLCLFKSCVPSKLVELVFIGLSSQNLHQSLESMLEFWGDPLSLLMIYASEGYLTKDSSSLFIELLDFISCAIEVDLGLQQAVTNFIPNLFGPVFGIHDGRVLCKVLEFGKLALKSRHRKKLLWDGMLRILKVYKLFEPIQIQRSKEQIFVRRLEAVIIALDILYDVIERCSTLISTPSVTDKEENNIIAEDANENTTQLLRQRPATTSEEVLDDQRLRVEILLYLMELANAMIASDQDILYMFASVLPRVFTPVPLEQRVRDQNVSRFLVNDGCVKGLIPWDVDLRSFAATLLALAADAQRNGACRPFQLCAVVLPKLVKNLTEVEIVDGKKLQLIEDILRLTHETLQAGHDIDVLISHGISLMSQLLPTTSSADEFRTFLEQLAKQLGKPSFSSVVLFVSSACDFMLQTFPEDTLKIQHLFLHLLRKGKRDDVRNICRLCNKALCETRLEFVRCSLYSHASGGLTSRQLSELSEILVSINSLSNEGRSSVPIQYDALVTGEASVRKRITFGLTNTIIERLREMLGGSEFNKTAWLELHDAITRVSVCLPLLTSEELLCEDKQNVFDLDAFLRRKFPRGILENTQLMSELGTISKRIQLMQKPRYESLKELVVKSLKEFLIVDHQVALSTEKGVSNAEFSAKSCSDERVPVVETTTDESSRVKNVDENITGEDVQVKETETIKPEPADGGVLYEHCPEEENSSGSVTPAQVLESQAEENWRQEKLEAYLLALPSNGECRERLVKFGYSEKLWREKIAVKVSTDGSRCIEENLRENLVACFSTYQDILKELGIPRVEVDGTMVDVDELFDTTISSVAELKGRRAIAVKLIDKYISRNDDVRLLDRKNILLATEDSIEAKFEEEARKPRKPITFTATINTNFFDCAKCCGSQIVGCYTPSGVHCERPLEIGIRQDSAFASIYDESDTEIENCELLFVEQGVYLFRAYTNSHPYDTSQVWIELFTTLLGGSTPYVPAIIIPYMHPSCTTWNSLRRHVPVEMAGSILTCDLDFSVKWQTYYDYRPESIRGGKDIVLKPGFDFSQSVKTGAFLQRQLSVENKDLGGLIFEQVMKKLCEDDFLKTFRFLGAHISLYINSLLENGYGSSSLLIERFDYERWLVHSKQTKSSDVPSKEEIILRVTELVEDTMSTFCKCVDFENMFTSKRHQLFELKAFFLQAKKHSNDQDAAKSILEINQVLRSGCNVTTINGLEESLQEEIMHWIFRNEDRVWRFRGGRDGYETLEQFMCFLGKGTRARGNVFPGIVVYIRGHPKAPYPPGRPFEVRHIVAYAVGEYGRNEREQDEDDMKESCEDLIGIEGQAYEVVTAWVHPRFRKLNLAVKMYKEMCRHIRAPFLVCDILENSVDNIIHSSFLFGFLNRIGFLSWFVAYRRKSYAVITQGGEEEQFERIVIHRNVLGSVIKLTDAWVWIKKIVSQPSFVIGLSSIPAGIFIYRHMNRNC